MSDLSGEFTDRVLNWNFVTHPDDSLVEACKGHGTSVASIAAGVRYGVAKKAQIIDVRVVPCKNNAPDLISTDDFTTALNYIRDHHPAGQPGIVNLSLRSHYSSIQERAAVDNAITNLVGGGLTVVLSGTESGSGACGETTASLGAHYGIIAVSQSTLSDQYVAGTGTGSCIDLFAPGQGIATTNNSNFADTSAAVPFVSGVAAVLHAMAPWKNPEEIEDWIKENATPYAISGVPAGTTSSLLHSRVPEVSLGASQLMPNETSYASVVAPEPGATYLWTVQNGTIIGANNGTTVNFRAGCGPARTVLKLALTNGDHTKYGYGAAYVLQSTARVSGSTTINAGQSATLSLSFSGLGPWTVWWQDGSAETFTTSTATRTVTPLETKTYRLISMRDGAGCTGSTQGYATVTVNGGCAPAKTTISTAPTHYSSATLSARVPISSGSTYSWSVINGKLLTPQGQNQIQYTLGCSGTTTVNVTITRSCGTKSSGTVSVAIVRSSAVVSGSQTIYPGQTATIQATHTGGTYPWSIIWSDGEAEYDIYHSDRVYREVTPSTTTTYTAEVRDKNGCSSTASGSATVTVQ